jgi:hypothetical protein
MKKKDDFLLEQLYQEGILDRLRGQGAGLRQGAGTLLQKAGAKISGQQGPQKSARAEYAKAQQTSLLNTFKRKVDKEIADFNNDLKSFKVNPDPNVLEQDFPIIVQRLKEIENLKNYLLNPDQYDKPSETISPDFEVMPPEGKEQEQQGTQQALPSSGPRFSLPDKSSESEPDAKEANKEFLQARSSNQQQTTISPSDTETQEPEQQEEPEQQAPVQKQETVNRMPYGKNEYSRREDGSWVQHSKKGSRYGNMPLNPQRNKQLIQKLNQASVDFKKPNKMTGSQVRGMKAAKEGKLPVQKSMETIGDSYNPFSDFLKGYNLL